MGDFLLGTGYFMLIFIVMAVVCNFIFLFLSWEFLGLESERGGSVCWLNNKIIDSNVPPSNMHFQIFHTINIDD